MIFSKLVVLYGVNKPMYRNFKNINYKIHNEFLCMVTKVAIKLKLTTLS